MYLLKGRIILYVEQKYEELLCLRAFSSVTECVLVLEYSVFIR